MDINHVHVQVRDLGEAVSWFVRVFDVKSTFRAERMAVMPFGSILLILDQDEDETLTTIGFGSEDCNDDFGRLTARGAVVIEEPADRPWGVRVAYLQGPGRLTIEIEQPLPAV